VDVHTGLKCLDIPYDNVLALHQAELVSCTALEGLVEFKAVITAREGSVNAHLWVSVGDVTSRWFRYVLIVDVEPQRALNPTVSL
jgi:hypothetical protein